MPDLKYGLPELLINIEMSIFAVLHLWAFSWRPYVIPNQGSEVTDFYGNGKVTYEGGRWGFKALIDSMNPLDLFKAVGRSARWLVIGFNYRLQDPSYQAHLETIGLQPPETGMVDKNAAYHGAGGTNGTKLAGQDDRYCGDEEGVVLLTHAQSNPHTGPLGYSPEDDSDGYLQPQQNRFYRQNNPSYDEADRYNTSRPSYDVADYPYPADGPLREQVPMPIPDPYRPPPPYAEDRHS